MNKLGLSLLASLFVANSYAAENTLEQAVAKVLSEHPQLQASFNQFKASDEAYKGAKGGYLPTVDLTAGAGWQQVEDNLGTRDANPTEIGVSLRQVLFSGFAVSGEVDRTANEARAEQWNLYNVAENLALRVVEVYLEVLKRQQLLELAEQNLETHRRIQSDIEKRTSSGLGSSADLTQINGRVARATTNTLAAKNNLLDAHTQYIRVVNELPKELIVPGADLDMLPADLDAAINKARQDHPLLKAAEFDIEAAHAQHTVSKSTYFPEFAVELDGNWDRNPDARDGTKDYELSAMLRMRYNLFRGGSDSAEIRRSAYQINQAKAINEDAHRQVLEGTQLAWNAWDVLLQQKGFLQDHVESSFDTVEAYKKQFNLGKRTLLDVLNTENELFEARNEYIEADFDELRAKYRLLNATGELLAALRVERPQEWSFE